MKFKGQKIKSSESKTYQVHRGEDTYEFTISPLPFGWNRRMGLLGMLDYPSPPLKSVRLANGQIVKDKDGKLEIREDFSDPTYLAECNQVARLLTAVKLATVLRNDTNVSWEAVEPTNNEKTAWKAYGAALADEIEASSLEEWEVADMISAAESIQSSTDLTERTDDFLDQ